MSRTILVTGSASGIGKATVARLRSRGDHVIGADLRNAEIEADLSTPDGRGAMIDAARKLAPKGLDGVLACAGIAHIEVPASVIAVNYFGAVATLEGLRPLLAQSARPRAVAICSVASLLSADVQVVAACLAGDEAKAKSEAIAATHSNSYASSKLALAQWIRRNAIRAEWAGAGILLNGIAPGFVRTPMTVDMLGTSESRKALSEMVPMAVDDYAGPEEIAELLEFLVNMEGGYLLGQVIFVDGGTEAILRPDII